MKGIGFVIGFLVLAAVLLPACRQSTPVTIQGAVVKVGGGAYYNITPSQLIEMLKNKDFLMVNVLTPYAGEIPRTDLFVPFNEIEPNLSKFPKDKSAKIVLYCRSGYTSGIAAETLVKLGFTNVWNVVGGMAAWEKEGNKIIQKQR